MCLVPLLCHWCAVLMEYEPQQGVVRLTLASDLNRDQKALVSSLAAAASEQWQQELHPGWSMAAADSEPLLNQLLQEVQVLVNSSFHFVYCLTVWVVESVVTHQTSWLASTGVLVCAQTCLLAADHVNNMQLCLSHKL